MSADDAAVVENPLQRLQRETRLGEGSDWADVLPKLVLHRGWHQLNSRHVRDARNTHAHCAQHQHLMVLPQETRPWENTLNAYVEAARADAVAVECDVWSSRDSKVNRSIRDFKIRILTKEASGISVSRQQLGFT
jgi:hypothetical protein